MSGLAFADLLAGGEQLPARPLGEPLGTHRRERVERRAQLLAAIDTTPFATQPLPVQQLGPGELGSQRGAAEPVDRFGVALLGGLSLGQQRPRACLEARRPVGTGDGRGLLQSPERIGRDVRLAGSGGGLDQVGERLPGERAEISFRRPLRGRQRSA